MISRTLPRPISLGRVLAVAGVVVALLTAMILAGWLPWATRSDVDARVTRGEYEEFKAGLSGRLDTMQRTLDRIENAVTRTP